MSKHGRGSQLVYDGPARLVFLCCEVGGARRARAFQIVAIPLFEPSLVVRAGRPLARRSRERHKYFVGMRLNK